MAYVRKVRTGSGAVAVQVVAKLRGRREILYGAVGEATEVIVPADWIMPPIAAVAPQGQTAVCWSAMTGSPSELTEGALPDPTQGVALWCRVRGASAWGPPARLGSESVAAWVTGVEPQADGSFQVRYYADGGLFVRPTSESDGTYTQALIDGVPGPIDVIELIDPDLLELGDPGDPGN